VQLAGEVVTVVDALPIAIVMTDERRRIMSANQAALELFGYDRKTLIGRELEILLPERFAVHHPDLYASFLKHPSTRPMGQGRDLAARKSDGQEFPVEVGLTVLQTEPPFYLASIVDLTVRKDAEAMLKDRQTFLESVIDETRKQLEEQVAASTRMEERQRLGRELHDTLSQSLYGIGLGLRTAMARADRQDDPRDALKYCLGLTESALVEMRALLFKLRPKSLEDVPLADVLRSHAQAMEARTKFSITFDHQKNHPDELDFDRKYALYRIATEALHNCTKHAADATEVLVRLVSDEDKVSLAVKDNGPGFLQPTHGGGHGLRTMRERAEATQGTLDIETSAEGTSVTVTIPRTNQESPEEHCVH
jgi:PAS domain S-box-containing protein